MEIDIDRQIDAVTRTVGSRTLEQGEVRTVMLIRDFEVEPAEVFDACTSAERIPQWFLPVTGELQTGGHYQLEGNAGGEVLGCNPGRSFLISWEFGGVISWVELEVSRHDGAARLELTHTAGADEAKWDEFGPGAVGVGWEGALLGLALHLQTGDPVDPEFAGSWAASPQGRDFMTASSRRWGDAAIAAGADLETAAAAAARTTAFYTGG